MPELLHNKKYNAVGIEYNPKCVQAARNSGFRGIYQGTVDTIDDLSLKHFNLITMIDVIEHLISPARDIEALSKLQQPGDRMLITTMNLNSLGYRIFKKYWHYIHSQHMYYFTKATLRKLFAKFGYRIEYVHRIPWYKSLHLLPQEFKKLRAHKTELAEKGIPEEKKWFATKRPMLYDLFTAVLIKA